MHFIANGFAEDGHCLCVHGMALVCVCVNFDKHLPVLVFYFLFFFYRCYDTRIAYLQFRLCLFFVCGRVFVVARATLVSACYTLACVHLLLSSSRFITSAALIIPFPHALVII